MKKKTVVVLGLGLFGSSVARTLAENDIEVIAVDTNMNHVEEVMDVVEHAVKADFTKLEQLIELGVEDCDIAIIATGEKLEDSILEIINLKKLKVPKVIVKTKNMEYKEVLLKVGADQVLLPEVDSGRRLGNELSSTSVLDIIKLDDRYQVIEIHALKEWVGKKIKDINVREKYGVNIIAIKESNSKKFSVAINPEYTINGEDILVILSENSEINNSSILNILV